MIESKIRIPSLTPVYPLVRNSTCLLGRIPHTGEFYQVAASSWHLPALNRELRQWEQFYNTVRPHQAPGYLTPQQLLLRWQSQRKE